MFWGLLPDLPVHFLYHYNDHMWSYVTVSDGSGLPRGLRAWVRVRVTFTIRVM